MANYPFNGYQPQNYGAYIPPQQAPYYPQVATPATAVPAIRTVFNEAEARAAQIPTDGNPVIFIEQSGDVIYTKKFSFETGAFPFEIYKKVNPEQAPTVRYATIEDLENLKRELTTKKGAKRNDDE